jgi:hypothetical protein
MLLESALMEIDKQGVNIVLSIIPKGHQYQQAYTSYGFIDSRINLHLYTTLNQSHKEHLLEDIKPSETQFNYGAIDSLPISLPNL